MVNRERATFALRIGFSAATAVMVLVGASLNVTGRSGPAAFFAVVAGLLALAAGALNRSWQGSVPLGGAAVILTLVSVQFNLQDPSLLLQVAGLVLLGLGGVVGSIAYRSLSDAIRRYVDDLEGLQVQLEHKHRAFLAATSDAEDARRVGDVATFIANIAQQVGADFGCYYASSPDGKQFVPQPPGIGLERLHPQPVQRGAKGAGPLVSAIEAGTEYFGADNVALTELVHYLPEDLHIGGLMAVPMRISDQVGGFILLGKKAGDFDDDDRRLATTLTMRAGAQLASAHAVALSRRESARYSLMNELIKEATGKTMDDTLRLVLDKGKQVVRYDAGAAVLFQPDDTYIVLGAQGDIQSDSARVEGPLAKVRAGESVLRNLITEAETIYSGLEPHTKGGTVNEALTPIHGSGGVIGAMCLGRKGTAGFTQRDLAALVELGSMAGIVLENSRILQAVTGQASQLDTTLDALGEVSQALTTVTQGSKVLEQKTLETAVRVTMSTAGLITRTTTEGRQKVITSLGFPAAVDAMEFQNGQGIIGAVMLNGRPTPVPDISASFDLGSPPDLVAYGLHAAICVPMLEDDHLWGTLSVFDVKKREWTTNDQRVLATLGNQGVVAVRNAELYDNNKRSIWELRNLQEALQAATSTLDLNQVLQQVLAGAAKASSAQIGCLALEDSGKLVLKGGFGTDSTTAERLALVVGGEICHDVMSTGTPVMQAMERETETDSPLNPRAVLCVPITLRGKPQGVLFLANYQVGHVFTDDHRNLVTELAAQAAVAIDNARLFKDREEVIIASLEALANAVDARDPYTRGHSERVTEYAKMIARQMRYAPKDAGAWLRLERGGRLHDIGKIGVPDAVLQKPGKLTDEEFAQMKEHPLVGFNILSGLKMLTDELVIVRSHHERYDGKGYPDRKKADELPMYAWIVSAADAIDAMTSDRPYRRGMSMEIALEQVRKGAGTHFHPDVAEAVLDAVNNGTLKVIREESMYKDAPAVGAFENPTS
ncbi:MAG TPA: GAF domain-containing protein [Candidatus Dormibacteraeota bacterium]|nr:GAF domain-containing protein [Candidatus Dormibacteraeota bacterium]